MPDRAQLEATLNERGVLFDYYADDATLEVMVAHTGHLEYSPAPVERDRGQLEQYLQARGVTYADDASGEQLRAAVEATIDAEHARYLERYQPIITRLPGAIGTSPELPDEAPGESEAGTATAAPDTTTEPSPDAPGEPSAAAQGQPADGGQPGEAPAVEPAAESAP